MELLEGINARHCKRSFKKQEVPKEVLSKVLEAAVQAPSWANAQPWKFHVVNEPVIQQIVQEYVERASQRVPINPDIPAPAQWPEKEQKRIFDAGAAMYEAAGIAREDKDKRRAFMARMYEFFGAPAAVILTMDRSLTEWSLYDLGLTSENLMLAAQAYGLGTCPAVMIVAYPEVLRRILGIPEEEKIIVGIAIGYPDDAPINTYTSSRTPVDEVTSWHGF
ncbi:MAG: nitroreductase [Bacillota bacterium]